MKHTLHFSMTLMLLALIGLFGKSSLAADEKIPDLAELLGGQTQFLDVDEAFKLEADILDDSVIVRFAIAPEYYLYKDKFAFRVDGGTLGPAKLPNGIEKHDEYFGLVEVYFNHVEITIPVVAYQNSLSFTVDFQGCAEAGLCYPPTERSVMLTASKVVEAPSGASISSSGAAASSGTASGEFVSEESRLVEILKGKSLLFIIGIFLLTGLLLTFTPCVFPMIPIITSIIAGEGDKITTGRALLLSSVYVLAMAITYAIVGLLVVSAGSALSGYFQMPAVVITVAIIFVLLSLAMFGLYELQLPAFLRDRLNDVNQQQSGGKLAGVAIMGALSAVVVSPCVTAPLAAILLFIAQTGDMVLGGVSLFALGIGMGIPLILVAVVGGKFLPKAGAWMDVVKAIFGVALLGMALYLVKHLLPGPVNLALWGLLLIGSGVFAGALELGGQPQRGRLLQVLGIVALVYGVTLIVGAAQGGDRLLKPLASGSALHSSSSATEVVSQSHGGLDFKKIKSLDDLERELAESAANDQMVMLDFFATYCVACYEFEDYTFSDAAVQSALTDAKLLQVDVTANDDIDQALMKHFNIFGLPAILFFDPQVGELVDLRASGFENAETFLRRIEAAKAR